ncbi:MAG TPA: ATP-grasp domain-containing protein [Anaerolineales bacterium]|nr:ATP-grasp domain-containing protein [Anaerolineales bacterium]HRF50620.1 ATP-grasp domain-containing protein [Anaerolineales bacterium]
MSLTFLCMASYFKGVDFMKAVKAMGHHVLLLVPERHKDDPWPRDVVDELFVLPSLQKMPDVLYTIAWLMRGRKVDTLVALDDFDVETAGLLRAHLRLPGQGETAARAFRDKLTMRELARAAGVRVPEYTRVVNYDELRDFMARVPAPWVLKPRSEASAMGIRKLHEAEQLWRALDQLGDTQSYFVLEQFVPGDVFHVDSLVDNGRPVFSRASAYARPPMNVYHEGGVFGSRTLATDAALTQGLLEINTRTLAALGMVRGANHAEFIRGHADGELYFLECAARVGGANIAEMVEYASGVNLWGEWARIEEAFLTGRPYTAPEARADSAGVLVCLARQQWPDLGAYADPEIVFRLHKEHHAGLIVAAPDAGRVEALLNTYLERFAVDFLTSAPPKNSVTEM